jgi:hypothetical protein
MITLSIGSTRAPLSASHAAAHHRVNVGLTTPLKTECQEENSKSHTKSEAATLQHNTHLGPWLSCTFFASGVITTAISYDSELKWVELNNPYECSEKVCTEPNLPSVKNVVPLSGPVYNRTSKACYRNISGLSLSHVSKCICKRHFSWYSCK